MINEEYLNIRINYCVTNTFRSHRTQSIKKDAFRYPLLSVLKMSTGCSILLDVHSKPSLASSISDPCFIILLLCADSSQGEIIFSLQSNFNNPVIFFSLYYSSVLNQMRGFFFSDGTYYPHFLKMKVTFFIVESNSYQKKVWTPFKGWFCNRRMKGFLCEIASP